MKNKKFSNPWPWLLIGLALLFLSLSGWSVHRASNGVSATIAPDADVPGGAGRLPAHHE
jgi:hypothetical protein